MDTLFLKNHKVLANLSLKCDKHIYYGETGHSLRQCEYLLEIRPVVLVLEQHS